MAQVLLVEPDIVLAKTYAAALTVGGHHVLRASEAQSAVNACDAVRPDIIVLEMQLPRHNGVEFIYELRSHADWQSIPIIILSQLRLERLNLGEDDMAALGIRAYCYKPDTTLKTLTTMVEEMAVVHE